MMNMEIFFCVLWRLLSRDPFEHETLLKNDTFLGSYGDYLKSTSLVSSILRIHVSGRSEIEDGHWTSPKN